MSKDKTLVLVLDDDEAVRDLLKFALELEGLDVRLCGAGEELLLHPDLGAAKCLILDFKMPEMDGIEVLDRLRAKGIRLPVVLITGHATAALRSRAAEAGVLSVLQKPLLGNVLLDSIRGAVQPARAASPS